MEHRFRVTRRFCHPGHTTIAKPSSNVDQAKADGHNRGYHRRKFRHRACRLFQPRAQRQHMASGRAEQGAQKSVQDQPGHAQGGREANLQGRLGR